MTLSSRLHRVIGCAAVLPLGLMCVSPSWAADTCTGYDSLVTQSAETTDLGHGLKQTNFKQQGVLLSNDSIYTMLADECSGVAQQTEDGKTQSMGYCARRDKELLVVDRERLTQRRKDVVLQKSDRGVSPAVQFRNGHRKSVGADARESR